MEPGSKNEMIWAAGNVPEDSKIVSTPLAKLAEAVAPERGDMKTTVFADKL
jgi:hypothetical protein